MTQEAEERVFKSVSKLKAGSGGADADDDEEDARNKDLLRSVLHLLCLLCSLTLLSMLCNARCTDCLHRPEMQ